jgi:hypothetical protein
MRAFFCSLSLLALTAAPASAQLAEICDNANDDDGDGAQDCADPDCAGHEACPTAGLPPENTPRLCQNERDDDEDGATDCDDPGCRQLIFCVNRPEEEEETGERCRNGEDDDGDGAADCDDDSCTEACSLSAPRDGQPGTRGIYEPRVVESDDPEMGFVEHDDPRRYPQRFVQRPMTYLSGMLVPRAGLSVRPTNLGFGGGDDYLTHLGAGVSYGVFDFWEVSVLPLPLRLAPSFDYENPAISTTLRFFANEAFEIGAYANVAIPVGTAESPGPFEPLPHHHLLARSRYSTVTQLDLALLARLHLGEWVRIDLALPVSTFVFGENALGELDARVDLVFDARVAVQLGDYFYAGLWTGAFVPGPDYDAPKVPFGFFAGGSFPGSRRGPAADVGLRFGWPLFFDSEPVFGVDEVDPDFWQMTLDVRIYTYLLP